MSTCAICLKPAPAGYGQCRDCISTFGVKENPVQYRGEYLNRAREAEEEKPMNDKQKRLQKFEEVEKMEREGDVEGLLRTHRQEEEAKKLEPLRKEARKNLRRMARRESPSVRVVMARRAPVRPPRFVWVLLAVYLGCAAAEHLSMASVYFLDVHARVTKGRGP